MNYVIVLGYSLFPNDETDFIETARIYCDNWQEVLQVVNEKEKFVRQILTLGK